MNAARGMLCIVFALSAVMLAPGCGDDDNPTAPQNGVSSDSLLQVANDSLGRLMVEMVQETLDNLDSSFRPGDLDFTGVYGLYTRAVAGDPANKSARFGCAFCGLMSFLADDDLNGFYDRMKNLVDTVDLSPAGAMPQFSLGRGMVPEGIPSSGDRVGVLLYDPLRFSNRIASSALADPRISELQQIFEDRLLPLVQAARAHLTVIVDDPAFTFILTPEMQGNPGADPIELDRADFRIFLAAANAFESAIYLFLSRNLDLESWDMAGLINAAQRNSDFLSLRSGDYMATAKTRLLDAESILETAIDDLLAEIGSGEDQGDDLIAVYPGDADDLERIKDSLAFYRDYFNGPRNLCIVYNQDIEWYCDYYGCYPYEVADTFQIVVDIRQFFDNPIDNPKRLLPGYVLTLDTLPELYREYAALHFSRQAYWDSLTSIYGVIYPNDSGAHWALPRHLPDTDSPEFYRFLAYEQQSIFGWDDVYNECSPGVEHPWCYYSIHQWTYQDLYWDYDEYELCYAWDAETFYEWVFPNPTINGLFPELTSDSLKDMLGVDESGWQQAGCGTFSPPAF